MEGPLMKSQHLTAVGLTAALFLVSCGTASNFQEADIATTSESSTLNVASDMSQQDVQSVSGSPATETTQTLVSTTVATTTTTTTVPPSTTVLPTTTTNPPVPMTQAPAPSTTQAPATSQPPTTQPGRKWIPISEREKRVAVNNGFYTQNGTKHFYPNDAEPCGNSNYEVRIWAEYSDGSTEDYYVSVKGHAIIDWDAYDVDLPYIMEFGNIDYVICTFYVTNVRQ
jgi:hypothetical protein